MQPNPKKNDNVIIGNEIIKEFNERMEVGFKHYNTFLQPFNGRDAWKDAQEELYDYVFYFKQAMIENKKFKEDYNKLQESLNICMSALREITETCYCMADVYATATEAVKKVEDYCPCCSNTCNACEC